MRYGKFISLILISFAPVVSAMTSDQLLASLEKQQGRAVYDYANVILAADEQKIESIAAEVRQKASGASVVVVMLSSLEGGEIDDFSNRLFEKWGIGVKGQDNGLLVLAAMQDRKMRIEVGYGLEGAIPDAVAGRIRRDVITPYFKSGQPGRGALAGVSALAQEIADEYGVQITGAARQTYRHAGSSQDGGRHPILLLLFLIFFIPFAIRHPFLAMFLLSGGRGGSHSGGGGFGGGGFGGGGFGGGMSGGGGSSGGW